MSTLKDSVVEIVSSRLKQFNITSIEDTASYVEEVEQSILNHCNILQVPSELKFVWVGMSVDYIRWVAQMTAKEEPADEASTVKTFLSSIREGDSTLGFSADTSSANYKLSTAHSTEGALDKIVMNYEDQLNRFRRLVW